MAAGGVGEDAANEELAMADEEIVKAGDDEMTQVLKEIRDLQREAIVKQAQFLWILVPIFAVLCVQAVLILVR